jgi:hypothetical protein
VWPARLRVSSPSGLAVRATTRSHEKGNYLKNMFESCRHRFEFVIVKDIYSVSRAYLLVDIH